MKSSYHRPLPVIFLLFVFLSSPALGFFMVVLNHLRLDWWDPKNVEVRPSLTRYGASGSCYPIPRGPKPLKSVGPDPLPNTAPGNYIEAIGIYNVPIEYAEADDVGFWLSENCGGGRTDKMEEFPEFVIQIGRNEPKGLHMVPLGLDGIKVSARSFRTLNLWADDEPVNSYFNGLDKQPEKTTVIFWKSEESTETGSRFPVRHVQISSELFLTTPWWLPLVVYLGMVYRFIRDWMERGLVMLVGSQPPNEPNVEDELRKSISPAVEQGLATTAANLNRTLDDLYQNPVLPKSLYKNAGAEYPSKPKRNVPKPPRRQSETTETKPQRSKYLGQEEPRRVETGIRNPFANPVLNRILISPPGLERQPNLLSTRPGPGGSIPQSVPREGTTFPGLVAELQRTWKNPNLASEIMPLEQGIDISENPIDQSSGGIETDNIYKTQGDEAPPAETLAKELDVDNMDAFPDNLPETADTDRNVNPELGDPDENSIASFLESLQDFNRDFEYTDIYDLGPNDRLDRDQGVSGIENAPFNEKIFDSYGNEVDPDELAAFIALESGPNFGENTIFDSPFPTVGYRSTDPISLSQQSNTNLVSGIDNPLVDLSNSYEPDLKSKNEWKPSGVDFQSVSRSQFMDLNNPKEGFEENKALLSTLGPSNHKYGTESFNQEESNDAQVQRSRTSAYSRSYQPTKYQDDEETGFLEDFGKRQKIY